MIKYVQYLIITWIMTSYLENFYRHNKLFTRDDKVEVEETGGLQSFNVNVRPR